MLRFGLGSHQNHICFHLDLCQIIIKYLYNCTIYTIEYFSNMLNNNLVSYPLCVQQKYDNFFL